MDLAVKALEVLGVIAVLDRFATVIEGIVMEIDLVGRACEFVLGIRDVEFHVVILVIRCRMLLKG